MYSKYFRAFDCILFLVLDGGIYTCIYSMTVDSDVYFAAWNNDETISGSTYRFSCFVSSFKLCMKKNNRWIIKTFEDIYITESKCLNVGNLKLKNSSLARIGHFYKILHFIYCKSTYGLSYFSVFCGSQLHVTTLIIYG